MHKKAPFMTALTALALATVALPDTAFSGTNPTNFRGCQKPEAVGQDKHQHEQACLDAKLRAVTEAVSKNVTQPEQPATGNNNGEQPRNDASLVPQIKNDGNVSADCQIWLCLPAGFPEGCGSALKAYRKRLRKGKAPMPPFASCAVGDDGKAASNGGDFTFREQRMRRIVDADGSVHFERGMSCNIKKDEWIPGCSIVHKTIIYQGNQKIGSYIE